EFDGSYGMTTWRGASEAGAGTPLTREATACDDNYERFSGKKVAPTQEAQWLQLQTLCDTLDRVVLPGLKAAGRNLTVQSFGTALEKIRNAPMGTFANLTFSPSLHA